MPVRGVLAMRGVWMMWTMRRVCRMWRLWRATVESVYRVEWWGGLSAERGECGDSGVCKAWSGYCVECGP